MEIDVLSKASTLSRKCWVCGDVGIGFGYEAPVFMACKVFFYRNANKQEKLKCRKDNNCVIDLSTRKSCSKCRLQKCYDIGMKSKIIATKKLNNSTQKQNGINHFELNILLELRSSAEPDEYQLPTPSRKRRFAMNLTNFEHELILQLQTLIAITFEDETRLECIGEIREAQDAINLPVFYLKRIARFCNRMRPFNSLPQTDQIKILKDVFIELLGVRYSFLFDEQRRGHLILGDDQGTLSYFIYCTVCNKFIEENYETCEDKIEQGIKLKHAMENDVIIRDLLFAQILCRPRNDITQPELMRYHYFLYCRLLRKYLEHKYKCVNKANRHYTKLMGLIDLHQSAVKNFPKSLRTRFDLSQAADMMLEIMDFHVGTD